MEKKQLDFNAPLLSVRRFSSPFKRDNQVRIENSLPNRRRTLPSVKSDLSLEQVTEPATVPFLWEHIPGRPKSRSGPLPQPLEKSSLSRRSPPPPGKVWGIIPLPSNQEVEDQNAFRPQTQVSHSNRNLTYFGSSNEGMDGNGSSDSEKDDYAYSDAPNTLSPTASFSLSCSVSGLSGSDGPVVKRSGTFSSDPLTRDFMMTRFLPAAKAMALEPSHFVSKKQPMAFEQPSEVKRMVTVDRRPELNQNGSSIIPYNEQGKEEEESESEHDDYDGSGNISAKGCGFLPRFVSKNSLCLLNPVPGMRGRHWFPKASTSEVGRINKTAYSGPLSPNVKKNAWDAKYKHKWDDGSQSRLMHEVNNVQVRESNQLSHSGDRQKRERSSPFRRAMAGCKSAYQSAPVSPCRPAVGFRGVVKDDDIIKASRFTFHKKGADKYSENFSRQTNERDSGSLSPMFEKTLYIDSMNKVKYASNSNSLYSDANGRIGSARRSFSILVENRGVETKSESLYGDVRSTNVLEGGGTSKPKVSGFLDSEGLDQESRSLKCLKVSTNGNLETKNLKPESPVNPDLSYFQSPLHPPLPKSPSESWLWRTLPTVPSRKLSRSREFAPSTSSTGTKWETIVKTSNLHYDHVRYSEELVAYVPKQSRK